ncbi:elongator complex protein 3 [Desulfocurvus sp. DL9XJH121]
MPFAGCVARCTFCNQHAVTGRGPESLDVELAALAKALEEDSRVMELAFFGGTFTALPLPWMDRFLELAEAHRARGTVSRVRCSTRPDALGPEVLERLRARGLDMVELGIQSFDDRALAAVRRGYGGQAAREGCLRVRGAGFALGVQLMPGLPGQDRAAFERDVETAIGLEPECVRLYPCMVLRDTALARDWERGAYAPWPLEQTVQAVGWALERFWAAGVAVIRVGLPAEPGLAEHVLAGPAHPALGQLARSEALFLHLRGRLEALDAAPRGLAAPQRWRSDVLGHARSMLPRYAALGLPEERIRFHDGELFWFDSPQGVPKV